MTSPAFRISRALGGAVALALLAAAPVSQAALVGVTQGYPDIQVGSLTVNSSGTSFTSATGTGLLSSIFMNALDPGTYLYCTAYSLTTSGLSITGFQSDPGNCGSAGTGTTLLTGNVTAWGANATGTAFDFKIAVTAGMVSPYAFGPNAGVILAKTNTGEWTTDNMSAPVPLPGAFGLLALGLSSLGLLRRRRA